VRTDSTIAKATAAKTGVSSTAITRKKALIPAFISIISASHFKRMHRIQNLKELKLGNYLVQRTYI